MGYITQLFAHRFALLFIIDQFSSDGLLLKYTFIVYRNKRIKFTREFIIHRLDFWSDCDRYLTICDNDIEYLSRYKCIRYIISGIYER
jgi:hypothetical protein